MIKFITKDASKKQLSDDDYWEIYQEIRRPKANGKPMSLDDFVELVKSQYSKAMWGKYHHGQIKLNSVMRDELRAAVGLPVLPPTVEEAVAGVDPNAEVIQVGDETPDRVILIGDKRALSIQVVPGMDVTFALVTTVTRPPRRRRQMARPVASREQMEAQKRLGVKWSRIIDAGIKVLEDQAQRESEE